ncbi:unnamed protein product [Coccothraustes coccothraustes]
MIALPAAGPRGPRAAAMAPPRPPPRGQRWNCGRRRPGPAAGTEAQPGPESRNTPPMRLLSASTNHENVDVLRSPVIKGTLSGSAVTRAGL